MAGALEGDVFIGPNAEEHRGLLSLKYPMEHGYVNDWADMERVWQYVYSKEQLNTFAEEVLCCNLCDLLSCTTLTVFYFPQIAPCSADGSSTEPTPQQGEGCWNLLRLIQCPCPLCFHAGSAQSVSCVCNCSHRVRYWLSLYFRYATGRTTGVVLDCGDGVTHAVPIYEGFALPHSIMRSDLAGRDVTRYLRLLLRKEGYIFRTSSEMEVVRTLKERACYLSTNPSKEESIADADKATYALPDGSSIEVGAARFRAPEVLFRPDLIGEECEGLHEVLVFAIQRSDLDLRKTLYHNIVLSGGSTLFKVSY